MFKLRTETWLTLLVLAVAGLAAAVGGLFLYVKATATPLHPEPKDVPSMVTATAAPKWAGAAETARQIARVEVADQNLPGMSVAVGIGGDIVWAEGFGWTDLESRTTVTPETRFRIGEASKAFTSAAVGLLLEQKKLNLDDEIQKYVPAFPKKQWPVTLRQLMAHVGGIRDDAGDEESLEPCEQTLEGLKRFADEPLRFEPGTKYRASSYSWVLVSAAVEAAAGERFFRFMRAQVFDPLGMADTRQDSVQEAIPNRATLYYPRFAGDTRYGPESAREGDHTCHAGASAFLSTPSDMVRFGMAMSGGKLLQPSTVATLQTSQRLTSGEETNYGLGWSLDTVPLAGAPTRMAGHGNKSDFIAGSAYLMTLPERGMVVAATTNISFADMKSVALKIAEAFAESGRAPAAK